jgi:hypothetical protein
MKRIYHPYHKWEEYINGMWRNVGTEEKAILLKRGIDFTGDAELYGSFMLRVIKEWPISCEHNLSNQGINRQAWIGHSATCIAINCPEDITRLAWHFLTQKQQDDANAKADETILLWEKEFKERKNECPKEDLEQMSLMLVEKE